MTLMFSAVIDEYQTIGYDGYVEPDGDILEDFEYDIPTKKLKEALESILMTEYFNNDESARQSVKKLCDDCSEELGEAFKEKLEDTFRDVALKEFYKEIRESE